MFKDVVRKLALLRLPLGKKSLVSLSIAKKVALDMHNSIKLSTLRCRDSTCNRPRLYAICLRRTVRLSNKNNSAQYETVLTRKELNGEWAVI
jgi:hypothetical protein